jgi:hypothetical protein
MEENYISLSCLAFHDSIKFCPLTKKTGKTRDLIELFH